ncbi:sigma 54-interacting transcriptional regulator [Metabacillus litoralis]|uniref:sigma-54 interaction domain-containing protein n=1 Tax=Metabacillus litoralis TaxID=152268 RepID=UPI001B9A3064|nr:sigma 54-interacting transcriptional regulator [Metabacillus litoralis]MCM3163516.1 sigma 54-interacting transcriptional regulator [Metabacillus litoralis]UHA58655.1 sigma 54-interacting transcriptional regulator [Metabacillus litoralis]
MEETVSLIISSDHKKMLHEIANCTKMKENDILQKLVEDYYFSISGSVGSPKQKIKSKPIIIDGFDIGDEVSDGIIVIDNKGFVLRINKAYSKITEINEKDIVGKHVQTFVDQKYFSHSASLLVLKEKRKVSILSTVTANKKKVLLTGTPIFDNDGEIQQVYTIMRDLTELIRLKEQLEEKEKENIRYYEALKYVNENKNKTDFIGQSPAIFHIKNLIEQVSQTDATVLITGETGVGKEVIASEVYKHSSRKDQPFIKVNCAAIPETLLESELFGYEKGAFTGAQQKEKLGLFELANRGTLLLDEIGEMPIKLQSKLLRCLQEKEITRVGGTRPIKIDVRVIAATNQNILKQIKEGLFREDLYYRLNVIPIKIPALRDRKDDIYLLLHYFLEKFNKRYNKQKKIDPETADFLTTYHWPGNVRELENTIERLVIIGDNQYINVDKVILTLGEDSTSNQFVQQTFSLKEAVEKVEKELICNALKKYGSTHKAAKVLGVTQPTVVRKAKSLGITEW